jgi:hypothetical protein
MGYALFLSFRFIIQEHIKYYFIFHQNNPVSIGSDRFKTIVIKNVIKKEKNNITEFVIDEMLIKVVKI